MKCAFELPTKHIKELREVQDFNFLLAHKVLESAEYRQAYGTGGLLDNSQYELGEPMDLRRLRMAEQLMQPEMVIAPDWLGDRDKTVYAYREASALLHSDVAGVVQGTDILDMMKCYSELLKESCPFICLPFRLARTDLMSIIVRENLLKTDVWYHFLGLKSMDELREIMDLNLPYVSIDTSKPIKAAIHGLDLEDNLRNIPFPWDDEFTPEDVEAMKEKMQEFMEVAKANDTTEP